MTPSIRAFLLRTAFAATGLTLVVPGVALAQGGDGFLFRPPRVTLKFETGYAFQRARSDIFDFTVDQLTIERRDFDSPYVGGELAVWVSERLDVAINVGYQSSAIASEFRRLVDQDDLPIEQVTQLRTVPTTISAKLYLRDRGRTIGSFAWIPTGITPFVGAGIGVTWYTFQQIGDFVDFDTSEIFIDRLYSDGEAFLGQARAGVDVSLGGQFLLTAEARYGWASGVLDGSFSGFDKMDLDGLQLVGGISVRF